MGSNTKLNSIIPLPKVTQRKLGYFKTTKQLLYYQNFDSAFIDKFLSKISGEKIIFKRTSFYQKAKLHILLDSDIKEFQKIPKKIKEEGYLLNIKENAIQIQSVNEQGVFYGLQTLWQIIETGKNIDAVKIIDWPDIQFRGVHLTLGSGNMPNFENMKSLIERFASYKINKFVIEYDDRFPWERHPVLIGPGTFSKNKIRELIALAKENFIEIIPLLDSLGHAQQYLKHKEYGYLKELPDRIDEMCPSNPGTLKFMKELWTEVLDVHKDSKYAHISGDEVFRLGDFCPKCEQYANKGRLHSLFTKYYKNLSRWIIDKGKIPIVWGDMLLKYPKALDIFPKDIIINDWLYYGIDKPYWNFTFNPTHSGSGRLTKNNINLVDLKTRKIFETYWFKKKSTAKFTPYPYVKLFKDKGFEIIGSTAASDAYGVIPFPDSSIRFANNKRFPMTIKKNSGLGILATYWSSSGPIESSWYGILACADYSWNIRDKKDEKEKEFSKRFVNNFLSLPEKYAEKTFALAKQIKRKGKKNLNYLAILSNAYHLNYVVKYLDDILEKIVYMKIGTGKDIPVNLNVKVNKNFDTCIPDNSLVLKPGLCNKYGINFNIIDPANNNNKSILVLKENDKIEIKLDCNFETLYFLWTAWNLPRGEKIATLKLKFASKKEIEIPIIGGIQVEDWWGKKLPLEEGFIGWQCKTEEEKETFAYFYPWENPYPKDKLISIKLECFNGKQKFKQQLNLIAITGRLNQKNKINLQDIHKFKKTLKQKTNEITSIINNCKSNYDKIMIKEDVVGAINKIKKYLDAKLKNLQKILSGW